MVGGFVGWQPLRYLVQQLCVSQPFAGPSQGGVGTVIARGSQWDPCFLFLWFSFPRSLALSCPCRGWAVFQETDCAMRLAKESIKADLHALKSYLKIEITKSHPSICAHGERARVGIAGSILPQNCSLRSRVMLLWKNRGTDTARQHAFSTAQI